MEKNEIVKRIAEEVAKALPSEMVVEAIGKSVESALDSFSNYYGDQDIKKLVEEAIVTRTKELLKTKYKGEVEKQAEILACRAITEMLHRKNGY